MAKEKNFVVNNDFVRGDESKVFFGGEEVDLIRSDADLPQILFLADVFSSRSEAKRNIEPWKEKLGLSNTNLPDGFLQFRAGKKNKLITILKPTEDNLI